MSRLSWADKHGTRDSAGYPHVPGPETDRDEISQTTEPSEDRRPLDTQAVLLVLGSGESVEALGNPGLVRIGRTIELGRRPTETDEQDVLVLSDRTVSGRHARIRRSPAEAAPFIIEDLGSRNGTCIDGRRIVSHSGAKLRDGALLFLGSQALVFRMVTPAALAAMRHEAAEPLGPIPTSSPPLALAAEKLRRLAPSDAEILLAGETGVGKEVFARAIHAASRRPGRFIGVNCAAIPAELVESELYGYEKGAHATARERKTGLVEMASHGTLFLDEIGEMHPDLQVKLLRFVQDRRYRPLGSTREIESNVRIIAATSRTVAGRDTRIQEALLGRLGAEPVTLPALRDRVEDIGRLAAHFLRVARSGTTQAIQTQAFQPSAFQALLLHPWPLNVRELSKVIGEAVLMSQGEVIGIEHLPETVTAALGPWDAAPTRDSNVDAREPERRDPATPADTAPGSSRDQEKQRIIEALALTAGNQERAAELLGLSRRTFGLRLDRFGIPRPPKRTGK